MKNLYKVLIIDDEREYRDTLKLLLESDDIECDTASSAKEALYMMEKQYYPIVVTDIMMDDISGIDFLKIIKEKFNDDVEVIMVTGYGSVETAVETMKLGAYGYFIKSHDPEELLIEIHKVKKAFDMRKFKDYYMQNSLKPLNYSHNKKMADVWELVNKVAKSNANVLILGESGTGKEIIANEIHNKSNRNNKPFIAINCQNYPSNLLESELFGHEKGAFTGALEKRIGKLEQSNGGTVFLDEIGDMSLDGQVKLLRTLENKKIERIGSNTLIDVDFRVVSATNKDIYDLAHNGIIREDFLYRINTFEIKIPPLRERREDLFDFINFFITKFSRETGKKIHGVDTETEGFLLNYDYPGNIRELKNIIERMIILCGNDGILHIDNFEKKSNLSLDLKGKEVEKMEYKEAKKQFDREYLIDALKSCEYNITKTGEKIGLSRRQLFNKIKEYGIKIKP